MNLTYQMIAGEDFEQRDQVVSIAQILKQVVDAPPNLFFIKGKRETLIIFIRRTINVVIVL